MSEKERQSRTYGRSLLARLMVLLLIGVIFYATYVLYRMMESGNVEQAVADGDFTATRWFMIVGPPSDEELQHLLQFALCSNQLEMSRYLLDKGADPNLPGRHGYFPPLTEYLAQCWPGSDRRGNRDQFVQLLQSHGAQFGVEHAVLLGDLQNVVRPVQATPALSDKRYGAPGWTLLHFAAAAGQYDVAAYLVKAGADVHAETYIGKHTPAELAENSRQSDVVNFFETVSD